MKHKNKLKILTTRYTDTEGKVVEEHTVFVGDEGRWELLFDVPSLSQKQTLNITLGLQNSETLNVQIGATVFEVVEVEGKPEENY